MLALMVADRDQDPSYYRYALPAPWPPPPPSIKRQFLPPFQREKLHRSSRPSLGSSLGLRGGNRSLFAAARQRHLPFMAIAEAVPGQGQGALGQAGQQRQQPQKLQPQLLLLLLRTTATTTVTTIIAAASTTTTSLCLLWRSTNLIMTL